MSGTQQLLLAEGGGGGPVNYIEDVFSTYLYTGNGSTQTITNNIDLSTKGGLVWIKQRSTARNNYLFDTVRGASEPYLSLSSNLTDSQTTNTGGFTDTLTSFNTGGFSLGARDRVNGSGSTYGSWTFRKQPKFFDVVTYTGNDTAGRTIAHSLGSTPGCIIVKCTSAGGSTWRVYHRSLGAANSVMLNDTAASASSPTIWNSTAPTSTVFTVGNDTDVNSAGASYVAYLFAHDAGGFGLTGTDNVISCGSYSGTGGENSITLGYEPQWLLIKCTSSTGNPWVLVDNMRGWANGETANDQVLRPNSSNVENSRSGCHPTATGFGMTRSDGDNDFNGVGRTYIYIAIRRGPMKVPTDGTTVFIPVANTVAADNTVATTNFPVDLIMSKIRTTTERWWWFDKLRGTYATGPSKNLSSNAAYAEGSITSNGYGLDSNTTFVDNFQYYWNGTSRTFINYALRRAPSFFDEVCYTGNGTTQNLTHNLGAVPALMFVKRRDTSGAWLAWSTRLSSYSSVSPTYYGLLNSTVAFYGAGYGNETVWGNNTNTVDPTSSVFTVGSYADVNASGGTYVAYLFATCAGVSKVGSYTGNGTLRTIDCGFTGGARFVLIKCTSSAGDWMVWDTARGMVAGTDYEQAWNTDGSQTNANSVYTITTGFQLLASPAFDVNVSGQTYIYLAIA